MKNNFIKTLILSVLSIYSITLVVSCNNKREPTPLKVLEVHFTDTKVDTISIVTDAYSMVNLCLKLCQIVINSDI